MPYPERRACEDPSSVIVQGGAKQVARSAFLISGLRGLWLLTVIRSRSGIHFENVCCPL